MIQRDGLIEDLVMPCQQGRHGFRVLLGKFCATFDIGEEKSDRSRGQGLEIGSQFGHGWIHLFE